MSDLTTSPAIPNAISLQALADGPMRSGLRAGTMSDQSGPAPVHVSRFRSLDSGEDMPTNDTSGPLFTASSPSASLQSSLESRLRARLAESGSLASGLTWKMQDMPAGPQLCRLSPYGLRIDVTGFGLLPTPSGTSNHGKNHVAGRIDEWGGSSNNLRGTEAGNLHLPGFELWTMGFPAWWRQLMPPAMRSSRKLPPKS